MLILGINAYHGDVSEVLLRDGDLVAAVEEERFRRVKHWAGFPREAIRTCLDMARVAPTVEPAGRRAGHGPREEHSAGDRGGPRH